MLLKPVNIKILKLNLKNIFLFYLWLLKSVNVGSESENDEVKCLSSDKASVFNWKCHFTKGEYFVNFF